jgi:Arm DNA-binding domain
MVASGLSAQFVRTAKPGRYCDGDGLYLLVKKSGARFWVFRFKVNGSKLREAGLGRAGEGRNSVRLSEARDKASTLFRQVKNGIDPLFARDAIAAAAKAAAQDAAVRGVTFREAARRFIDGHTPSWKNPKHAAQWGATIEIYANPAFGDLPVGDVGTAHVLGSGGANLADQARDGEQASRPHRKDIGLR